MLKELYTAALGMMPQQTRMEVISNNLANANTIGFKRASVFERNLIDARANLFNVPGDVEQDDVPVGSYVSFDNGIFQHTGNKLDLAIQDANSFFVVENPAGEKFYTKAGNFTISDKGDIITNDGNKLMGSNGGLNIMKQHLVDQFNAVDNNALEIRISQFGEVFVNDEEIDSIALLRVNNPNSLINTSASNFTATDDTVTEFVAPDQVNIKQGWIEQSNVNVIDEMIEMIQLQRLFETGSKVISTNNETLDYCIQMGRFY